VGSSAVTHWLVKMGVLRSPATTTSAVQPTSVELEVGSHSTVRRSTHPEHNLQTTCTQSTCCYTAVPAVDVPSCSPAPLNLLRQAAEVQPWTQMHTWQPTTAVDLAQIWLTDIIPLQHASKAQLVHNQKVDTAAVTAVSVTILSRSPAPLNLLRKAAQVLPRSQLHTWCATTAAAAAVPISGSTPRVLDPQRAVDVGDGGEEGAKEVGRC
jgi:hypothetical protein